MKVGRFSKNFGLHTEEWAANDSGVTVNTPNIVITDTSRYAVPFDYQIQEAAQGVPLHVILDNDTASNITETLYNLGSELNRIHSVHLSGYGHLDPTHIFSGLGGRPRGIFNTWSEYLNTQLSRHIKLCEQDGLINEREAGQIEQVATRFERFDFAPTLLHNDLSPSNIYVFDGTVSFIDWGDAIAGDPIFDLANACSFYPPSYTETIINGYYHNRKRPLDFSRRFWSYYLRIVVAQTTYDKTGMERIRLALGNIAF